MCKTAREERLEKLLKETLEWVTAKPWDDNTFLHKRVSEELDLPIEYPDWDYGDKDDE